MSIVDSLNSEQQPPVFDWSSKAVLLVAGAGAGKTRVMTARAIAAIKEQIDPRRICAITFTNKAANELRERVMKELDISEGQHVPRVSTIHSLALNAIRRDPEGFGLTKSLTTLSDYDQSDMIDKLMYDRKKDKTTSKSELEELEALKPYKLIEKIQFHRARGIGFAIDYTDEVHAKALVQHSGYHALTKLEHDLWARYEVAKKQQNTLDFDDMLYLVVKRSREDNNWSARLKKQFRIVLMDEGQDASKVQWDFVSALVGDDCKLMVVGDPSQSIYAFNGAAPELLLDFAKGWQGHPVTLYKLARNHRSVPEVVSLANRVQSTMVETIPLEMISHRGEAEDAHGHITLSRGSTAREIAQSIAEKIRHRAMLKRDGLQFKDNAILVRSSYHIKDIEPELVRARIPYVIRGGQGLLQSKEVRDVLAYLRLIVNRKDVSAFSRAISVPSRSLGDAYVSKVQKLAETKFDFDMLAAAKSYDHPKAALFLQTLELLSPLQDSPSLLVDKLVKMIKYAEVIAKVSKNKIDEIENRKGNIIRFMELLDNIKEANPTFTLEDITFQLAMNSDSGSTEEGGSVVISTVHAAKGLEWPRVFVFNVIEGAYPIRWAQSDKEVEEEKRIFYVAITRAVNELVLCVPGLIQVGPNTAVAKPSRFLFELGLIKP